MKRLTLGPACALIFLLTLASVAIAAEPDRTVGAVAKESRTLPSFTVIDANKDGVVTLPEIEVYGGKALVERLRECDTNDDSRLSREEYAACKRSAHTTSKPDH